ncbi:integrase family protein [Caldicellulosiruptor acetigenus I77R1B]|uniref:Integrase family protein n=1 Tax=Caldicellulosiruptor acetigenus (strain ATCC 700853 / DSM 12137 / I77R1B) TaxID=632335 RepID=E4S9P6_CALA7|nr:tyrosine-type recombinase/integrase [Caldicellulosiruptor acetigenus]ADQ41039.1 integrase family protein [Caldicellulosiruptor acetigenus I77R1B]
MPKQLKVNNSNSDWEDALQLFLSYKKAQGRSDLTIRDYEIHIRAFFKRYPDCFNDTQKLRKCLIEYLSQPMKPVTYNLRMKNLKAFLNWCVEEGIIPTNPIAKFKPRKTDDRIVEIDIETLQKLLQLPDRKTFAGLRDYALMLLTLDTGIRPKEAFSLLKDHFDFKNMQVVIPSDVAKTRVSRVLPISPVTANAIKKLISSRHPQWDDSVPVFCSVTGKPLNRYRWNERMREYSKQLGVKIKPYDLRHMFALLYLKNGGYELSLQKIMGHTTLEMTKKYVHFTQKDLQDIHAKATPINTLLKQPLNRVGNIKNQNKKKE